MNIGIDIDGVLIETQEIRIRQALEYAKNNNITVSIDRSKDDTNGLFDWDEKIDLDFFEKTVEEYYFNSPVIEKAKDTIKKLKSENHKIYFITARGSERRELKIMGEDKVKDITKRWFNKNQIPNDDIIFAPNGSKSKVCLDYNIDVLIDDGVRNIQEVSKIIPVIAYKTSYNEHLKNVESNYKIYWTDNWNEIFNIIEYRM